MHPVIWRQQVRETEPAAPREQDYYRLRPRDLVCLRELRGWRLAEGEPNIRGWAVYDIDNSRPLGTVEDLLVSPRMRQAVFVVLDTGDVIGEVGVDYGAHGALMDCRILIPIDRVEIDMPDNRVLFAGSIGQLCAAPVYELGTRDFGPYYDYWQAA